jgi:phosphopantetheinyl transferase
MTLPRDVFTSYATIGEALLGQPPQSNDWLAADERGELVRLRDRGRQSQWLAGRWLSKRLIAQAAGVADLADIRILTRDERARGVRPMVFVGSRPLRGTLSISHSDRGVLVALAATNRFSVGVDLAESVERSEGFRRMWFSASERRWLAEDVERRMTILWAIKEAVYKAAHTGDTWDPRAIEVAPSVENQFRANYRGQSLDHAAIDVRDIDQHVAAIVVLASARSPHESLEQADFDLRELPADSNCFATCP